MNNLLDHIGNIYVEQLTKCSEICRKIAFSLFAIIWALSYTDGNIVFTNYSIIALIFLVAYLILDTSQYFITAISYRKHFKGIKEAILKGGDISKINKKEVEKREAINDRSFLMMIIKVALLPFAFIGIIITLFSKI
jgi:hypothetical protein